MLEWRGVTSASRVYGNASYEISDDLQRRTTAVLERRYDGRDRAHRAATIIQRAYRHYKMSSRFKQMIPSGSRKRKHDNSDGESDCKDCQWLQEQLNEKENRIRELQAQLNANVRNRSIKSNYSSN